MKTAMVTTESEGKTIHLPPGIDLRDGEFFVTQVGQSLVLVPKEMSPWRSLLDSLDQFSDDFMEDRTQPSTQCREPVFE